MTTEAHGDLDGVDTPKDMTEFLMQVRERAKHVARNCVEVHSPHIAAKALWMLAQGARITDIAKLTGLGHAAIRALEWRHEDTLESKRKDFSRKYALAAAEYTDLLFTKAEQLANSPEELSKISPDRLALVVGIMTDKSTQLSGMPSAVIEHRKGTSIDEAAKLIEEAKMRIANKQKAIHVDAEVVE